MSHESDLKAKHDAEDAKAKADESLKPKKHKRSATEVHDSMGQHMARCIISLYRAVHGGSYDDPALNALLEDLGETPAGVEAAEAKVKADKDAREHALEEAKAKDKEEAAAAKEAKAEPAKAAAHK